MSDEELTPEAVARLAKLARLSVPQAELETMARELRKIIGYVKALQEVDTRGVEPTAHVLIPGLPLRPDEAAAGVERAEALAQAPRHDGEGFRVPGFVEG
jgi:aspartyl-tRNA(Asn)/glutamyl-tRNA(Gln) amidotransferase subunit C